MPLLPLLLASLCLSAQPGPASGVAFPAFARDGQPAAALVEAWQNDGAAQRGWRKAPTTLMLAPGRWSIRVSVGPHFRRMDRDVEIRTDEMLDFGAVAFERAVDLRKAGWYDGGYDGATDAADWTVPRYMAHGGEIGAIGALTAIPPSLDRLPSYDALAALRHLGGATLAASLHAGLPFDAAAAQLVDGLVVTEGGDHALALWSLLLDHGHALTPVAGAAARMAVHCPGGLSPSCVTEAIRQQRVIVSTGPSMAATVSGRQIEVAAWARQDRPDRLLRVELWAHNRVIATREATASEQQSLLAKLTWTPQGAGDWVAVRVVAESGWALSSAFLAEPWPVPPPLVTQLKMVFPELASQQQAGALASVWSAPPGVAGARRLFEVELERNELTVDTPVAALVRLELADGRSLDVRPVEASGVRARLLELAGDSQRGAALLEWALYEDVLRRCRSVLIESRF